MAAPGSPNVFLAYSREDNDVAQRVLAELHRRHIDVWWDVDAIPIGAKWEEFLTAQLDRVRCVIVLWSQRAVNSQWVLFEAEQALRRNVLLPVLIERGIEIPRKFMAVQAASLVDLRAGGSERELERLMQGVERLMLEAPDPAQTTRVYKESQRIAERRARELLQRNLRSEVLIEHIDLDGTSVYEELTWNVNANVNVLLGRNGYGKTFLLRGIVALLQYNDNVARQILAPGRGSVAIIRDGQDEVIDFAGDYFAEDEAVGQLPVLAIPDTRFVNRSMTMLSAPVPDETTDKDRADLAEYGAWHFLRERPYEGLIQTFLYGLCLDYIEAGSSFESEPFRLIAEVVRELTDSSFEFARVSREGRDRFTLYVRTEGNEANPLPIQKASQGTLSVVAMIGLIYDYLRSLRKEDAPEVRQRCGIVLIDEIDAHLHPVWQQKIVSILRARFPRVQFLLTAHNPIVVAGCLEDEVSVLRKTPRGFSLVQFPNDFIGWQTEDIYRKVFEIENPDATFTRYDSLRPFKKQLKEDAERLAQHPQRSAEEERSLQTLETQLLYIDKVEQTRAERLTQEELQRENRMLREQVTGLQSARHAAAEARGAIDALQAAIVEAKRAAARSRPWVWIGPCLLLLVIVEALLLVQAMMLWR